DNITLSGSVGGALTVTANGGVAAGVLVVGGPTSIAAGAANDVIFDTAGSDFGTFRIVSGRNVRVRDPNALTLGTSTISGTLIIVTAGTLAQSGPVSVAGDTTLNAGAGNTILLNLDNDFATVTISNTQDATLRD